MPMNLQKKAVGAGLFLAGIIPLLLCASSVSDKSSRSFSRTERPSRRSSRRPTRSGPAA
jgi:hypothetical protein